MFKFFMIFLEFIIYLIFIVYFFKLIANYIKDIRGNGKE